MAGHEETFPADLRTYVYAAYRAERSRSVWHAGQLLGWPYWRCLSVNQPYKQVYSCGGPV